MACGPQGWPGCQSVLGHKRLRSQHCPFSACHMSTVTHSLCVEDWLASTDAPRGYVAVWREIWAHWWAASQIHERPECRVFLSVFPFQLVASGEYFGISYYLVSNISSFLSLNKSLAFRRTNLTQVSLFFMKTQYVEWGNTRLWQLCFILCPLKGAGILTAPIKRLEGRFRVTPPRPLHLSVEVLSQRRIQVHLSVIERRHHWTQSGGMRNEKEGRQS